MRALVVVAVALASCAAPDVGIQLTITADATVSDDALAKIVELGFTVAGAESDAPSVILGRAAMRTERIVYRPAAATRGTLQITVVAHDADGRGVAAGATTATIDPQALAFAQLSLAAAPPLPCSQPPDADRFVDLAAAPHGNGSAGCPFQTVTAAIASANATTRTVHVAAGTYDAAHGEVFPLTLAGLLSLDGAGAKLTVITGSGDLSSSVTQSGRVHVTVAAGDLLGTNTISHVTLLPDNGQQPTTDYVGVLCQSGTPNAPSVRVDGATVGPRYEDAILGIETNGHGCNLTITGSTVTGNVRGIWMSANPSANCETVDYLQAGDGTAAGTNQFLDNDVDPSSSFGILVWDCAYTVVNGNVFDGNLAALRIEQADAGAPGKAHVVTNNVFRGQLRDGIELTKGGAIELLQGNQFLQNTSPVPDVAPAAGLLLNDWSQVRKARGNQFVGNDYGVLFAGEAFTGRRPQIDDFGLSGDDGGNVFSCNSLPLGTDGSGGYDFAIANASGMSGTVSLYGNQWDHAPPLTPATGDAPTWSDLYVSTQGVTVEGTNTGSKVGPQATCPSDRTP